jgi:2-polyprenyl-3-methyl-5-hydroxy-6-metoxy-1,4-benzoquinol methylase
VVNSLCVVEKDIGEMETEEKTIARGKPADYGQEIVKRRFRLTAERLEFRNKTVLDFGCGNGAQTVEFLETGCHIIAVDIDQQDLSVLKDYITANNLTSIVPMQYDGHSLPLQSASVDIVVSYEVIEHVEDESQALNELHRVLKPEGCMIISVPNKGWVFETHGAHLPLLPWNRVPFFSWLPRTIHRRYAKARIYRKNEIIRLLQSHSFDVLEALYITAPMDVVKTPWIKKLLRATVFSGDTTKIPFLSTSILVHCRRK